MLVALIVIVSFALGTVLAAAKPLDDLAPVREPTRLFVSSGWANGWVRASGRWRSDTSPEIVNPPGTQIQVDLNCYRSKHLCIEAVATLRGTWLLVSTAVYDIKSWGANRIITVPNTEPCGAFTLIIDRDPARVRGRFVNSAPRSKLCSTPGVVEETELDCVSPGAMY